MNPFRVDKTVSPDNFCGRVEEIKKLSTLIQGKANVIIYGDRSYGKTSLIQKVFTELPSTILPIYVNIYSIVDEMDFVTLLYDAIEKATSTYFRKQSDKLVKLSTHIDGVSLSSKKSNEFLTIKPNFKKQSFKQLLDSAFYLIDQYCRLSKCTHAVVAFGDFQQVAEIKHVKIDAMLRSISQSNENVSFIFTGSRKKMLKSLCNEPSQPWYGMTTPISLEGIEPTLLQAYCEEKLNGKFDDYAFIWLYETLRGQIRLIQKACFDFYTNEVFNPSIEDVVDEINRMISARKSDFTEKFLKYRGHQKKALRAIASATQGKVYAQENLNKHNITKQNLNQAISSLMKSDEIQKLDEGTYQFNSVLFGLWMTQEQH